MKKKLRLKDEVTKKVNNSIFITGSARSGTTIMGKIVHSMNNIEYAFEPPTLLSLFTEINNDNINNEAWRLLFETYLYEDFFVNAIAGRNLNFKPDEDSYIHLVKTKEEISERIESNSRKHKFNPQEYRIAFKIPDVVPYLKKFCSYYPHIRIIFMQRNPVDTINSLLRKGWFSDKSLQNDNRIWPFTKYKGHFIPHWVEISEYDKWIDMTEVDRCGYYFLCNYDDSIEDNIVYINYDYFVREPDKIIDGLCNNLNLKKGVMTGQILSTVGKTNKDRDDNILKKITSEISKQLIKADDEISKLTINL